MTSLPEEKSIDDRSECHPKFQPEMFYCFVLFKMPVNIGKDRQVKYLAQYRLWSIALVM